MTKIGGVRQVWRSVFLGQSAMPPSQWVMAQASPKFLGPPTYNQMVRPIATKFGILTRGG